MTEPPHSDGARRREPIFFAPSVVVALVAALLAIHAILTQLGEATQADVMRELAFAPGRLTYAIWPHWFDGEPLEGGAKIWTLVTYALLHGSWGHVVFNSIWLIVFGPPVARRFGSGRFLAFLALTAAAGALAHWASDPMDFSPLIGASAADSGLMGAAARFVFQPGAPLGGAWRRSPPTVAGEDAALAPPLRELLRQRRAVLFIAIWMAVNFVFGAGAPALGASETPVAWIAHMGGFVAGLLAFPLFDRRRAQGAAAPA